MSGHKPWNEISEKLRADPERRARIEQREQAIEAELLGGKLEISGKDRFSASVAHPMDALKRSLR
ncbi:MAG TPA: hypothetical protein VNG51_13375 [Ktedonobacteraceae bacterium]|nr:hypothetical protein [Ktedonobacteraceae bacterium]